MAVDFHSDVKNVLLDHEMVSVKSLGSGDLTGGVMVSLSHVMVVTAGSGFSIANSGQTQVACILIICSFNVRQGQVSPLKMRYDVSWETNYSLIHFLLERPGLRKK